MAINDVFPFMEGKSIFLIRIKGSIELTHGSACSDVRKLQSMDVLKLSNSLSPSEPDQLILVIRRI